MAALRGDYASIGADYIVEQDWGAYSPAQHALYRRLYARQSALVPKYACAEFNAALREVNGEADAAIEEILERLRKAKDPTVRKRGRKLTTEGAQLKK